MNVRDLVKNLVNILDPIRNSGVCLEFSAFLSITYDLFRIAMIALNPFRFLIYDSVLFGILMNTSGLLGLSEKCLDYLRCALNSFLGSSVLFFLLLF